MLFAISNSPHTGISRFLKSQSGNITIEGVLWLPVYAFFLTLIVDTSLMLNGQAQARRAIQDLNRLASTGYYRQETEIEDRGRAALRHLSRSVIVDSVIDTSNRTVLTIARIPAGDLAAIGLISSLTKIQISVSAKHVIEN